ncbi:DNA-processing protein DprA [Gammaproteobacteria bacterium]|nr:DNA-processing protein DprA [Gammaproteobacteria bacterium]
MQTIIKKTNIKYWLATNYLNGFGPVTIKKCISHFGSIESFFLASKNNLTSIGLTQKRLDSIKKINWDFIERDYNWCQTNDCQILCLDDPLYPKILKEISDPPLMLFVKGDANLLNMPQISMIGSRNPSFSGKENAYKFASQLSKSGVIITSGLAIGIDTASHKGALSSNCKTIAVLGSGLANIYPLSNKNLACNIVKDGALVSEFSPFETPKSHNFPRRNRLISGLSLGVLVVEAAIKSGSLITARFAIEQCREVFAIPGSINNALSRGCHNLIRQGAVLVETVDDILKEIDIRGDSLYFDQKPGGLKNIEKLDEKSLKLLKLVSEEVTSLDAIILNSGLTASEASSELLCLELQGCIKSVHGGYINLI